MMCETVPSGKSGRPALPASPGEMRTLILKLRWMGMEADAERLACEMARFLKDEILLVPSDTD